MTTKAASSQRHQPPGAVVPVVKPQCKIHPTALVADKAQITGSHVVEIGENAIIHPYAKLRAEHGNLIVGKGSMIAERAVVGAAEGSQDKDLTIGDGVSIESGAVVEAKKIGDHTTIGINTKIGRGAVLGSWCKVAPLEVVADQDEVEDWMVIFGDGRRRINAMLKDRKEVRDVTLKGNAMEMQALRGVMVDAKAKWAG